MTKEERLFRMTMAKSVGPDTIAVWNTQFDTFKIASYNNRVGLFLDGNPGDADPTVATTTSSAKPQL